MLSEREVSEEKFSRRISVRTLQSWRARRQGPSFVKLEGRVLYRESDVDAYIEASHVNIDSTDAA